MHKIAGQYILSIWGAACRYGLRLTRRTLAIAGLFEAGEQDAFADHAGGAGDDDVEVVRVGCSWK